MSSKSEDFPVPIPPTRMIVYTVSALFFDVLIIPFLRDSTSLGNTVKSDTSKMSFYLLESLGDALDPIIRITGGGDPPR
jgi:hypothetical protein